MSGEDKPFERVDPYHRRFPTDPDLDPISKPVRGTAAVKTKRFWGAAVSTVGSLMTILSLVGVVPFGLEGPVTALLGTILGYVGGVQAEEPITHFLPKKTDPKKL